MTLYDTNLFFFRLNSFWILNLVDHFVISLLQFTNLKVIKDGKYFVYTSHHDKYIKEVVNITCHATNHDA